MRFKLYFCCVSFAISLIVAGNTSFAQIEDTRPEYSALEFLQRQLRAHPPKLDVPRNARLVPKWQKNASKRLRELLRVDASRPIPLNPRITETSKRDGYRIERIIISTEEFTDVPALLLVPDGVSALKPAPAVLCIPGNVPGGKDEVAGETSNPEAVRGLKIYKDDFARQLVQRGFVALVIDLRNHGERKYHSSKDLYGLNNSAEMMELINSNALMMGRTFFGLNLFDLIRSLDYLESRPDVKRKAIGCAGFSLGGNLAAWLAALDRRIKVVALEGNWSSWRRLALRDINSDKYKNGDKPLHFMPHMSYQVVPDFFTELDMNLSIAATTPTPMIISFEYDNWQFEGIEEARTDTEPIRRAYSGYGAGENLKLEFVGGPHQWRADVILPWFTEKLRRLSRKK